MKSNLERRRRLLDGRLKEENYLDDLEENLEENLEEEPGQNIRIEKKEIERKILEDLKKEIDSEVERKNKNTTLDFERTL